MTARGEGCAEIRLPAEVSTKRLTLRRWKRADIPLLQGAIETNLDHLRPWMAWIAAEPLGDNDREALIETWDADWTCGGDVVYGVFAGDVIVGGTGLHRRRGPSVLEIGYWIHVDHTRRGYASEIAATLTSTAFGVDGIERVEIHHDRANTLSRRIPDALGYHLVGEEPDEPEAPGEVGIDCAWSMSKHVWLARTTVDTDN